MAKTKVKAEEKVVDKVITTTEPVKEIVAEVPAPVVEKQVESEKPVEVRVDKPIPDSEEIKFLKQLVYQQYHGGHGSHLNKMIISHVKSILKKDSVFIDKDTLIV